MHYGEVAPAHVLHANGFAGRPYELTWTALQAMKAIADEDFGDGIASAVDMCARAALLCMHACCRFAGSQRPCWRTGTPPSARRPARRARSAWSTPSAARLAAAPVLAAVPSPHDGSLDDVPAAVAAACGAARPQQLCLSAARDGGKGVAVAAPVYTTHILPSKHRPTLALAMGRL